MMVAPNELPARILSMFREGKDTQEIAQELQMKEATVSRYLWVARCQEKGLPAVFQSRGVLKQISVKAA
jgi:transposase